MHAILFLWVTFLCGITWWFLGTGLLAAIRTVVPDVDPVLPFIFVPVLGIFIIGLVSLVRFVRSEFQAIRKAL